jgi:hypothetical protein
MRCYVSRDSRMIRSSLVVRRLMQRRVLGVAAASFLIWSAQIGSAQAVPMLQLDIAGGHYDSTTETIVSGGTSFTLAAIVTPPDLKRKTIDTLMSQTFYISAAISPQVSTPGDLGYFTVDGQRINATKDMTYGTPPIEQFESLQGKDPGDLQPHGIFPTYFKEFAFSFDPNHRATTYDTALNPGGLVPSATGGSYYHEFIVDTSHLNRNFVIHFDFYTDALKNCGKPEYIITQSAACKDVDVTAFAPYSHDAESSPPVPEPTTLVLLGTGLVGAGVKKFRKRRTA